MPTHSHCKIKKFPMKRLLSDEDSGKKTKKMKRRGDCSSQVLPAGFANLDDNLLFEVFKHVDARTLATAAGVSKQWYRTAHDDRLWELICTTHWPNIASPNQHQQLRSVVLALGGFRRLHSLYPFPPIPSTPWGKDEVHLSLSLLSIRFYERMKFKNAPTS